MACDCKVEDTKSVVLTRTLPGAPPQQVTISVTIESECKVSEDAPGDTAKVFLSESRAFQASVRLTETSRRVAAQQIKGFSKQDNDEKPYDDDGEEKPNNNGGGTCLSSYVVKLNAASTAGLKLTEVKLGSDTFAVEIPVGGFEIIVIPCDEACAPARTGSVKVIDPFGNFLAQLSRIQICECGPFA